MDISFRKNIDLPHSRKNRNNSISKHILGANFMISFNPHKISQKGTTVANLGVGIEGVGRKLN